MTTHEEIYANQAVAYDLMISRQPDLTEVISEIKGFHDLDVLDLGAGSGRLAMILAQKARSLVCTDRSSSMLDLLERKFIQQGTARHWQTVVADHRQLPIPDESVDLAVSGWSISYLTNSGNPEWRSNLERIMSELYRVVRVHGTIVIFETLGTGTITPDPPEILKLYYSSLEKDYGFQHTWIRTDYTFRDVEETKENMAFFFGESIAHQITVNQWSTVPECAGVWWKHL
ncbi:class I SAM-dependent methyltransferase [Paenibacillus sp. 7541]|uniref:class I SAM-dependent methyltransferase n=1 Tax=Paenibacillus sp. 7541 TaxID=2026236 RepID=UPI000BA56BAE|nr:class I SAM-dependent methyltransferase [Paenibacillus sp. 7541]PAK52329.1 SAM-dependent methyltransferase [Paenibacillus sp. 7541]